MPSEADADAVAEAKQEMDLANEAINRMIAANAANTDVTAETAKQMQEFQSEISGVQQKLNALIEAYNEAYNAAYESVSGQYQLWDEAAKVVATSAGSINSALESQITYWQDYNANLQSLTDRSADIEGLSDMIASFAAGSSDSVNAVAGMAAASDKQLKSERLKTELITNVSHDIKTPLTSIINYVDLLQHEHTPEQEEEYLAVLKRQAFKLKKLTEDLVEASKATTGNLPVNAVRCSMNELLSQVEGEYGDKLSAAELTLVSVMPDKELFCNVDGALMWRVIDNLLSNICKYAQNGTRVYLTLEKTGGDAVVTFKNTSRAALNIPAEELMERFVRGDSSRSTEGNGLGLSIAQSLTELQGGKMSLAIDGDLFKAILRFPTVV